MASAPVVILGAGFAGCATAWALARRGIATRVLEREPELGRAASGRGAGLGRQLCEDDVTSALAIAGAARLRTELRDAWTASGGILTFEDAAHAEAYVARAARLAVPYAVLDREAVLRAWPQLAAVPIASAIHVPSDGIIDAAVLLRRLSAGIDITFGAAATRIEPTPTGARVYANEVIDARVVVDAAGAWAGALLGDPPLESFKRHLFVVEAAPAASAPYLWHLGACELYVRADAGNVLVSPCDAEPTPPLDQVPSSDADARLRDRFAATPIANAPVLRRWACQRAFAPDRRMRLGRDRERSWLVWAAALGGHGATASPAVGETVADAIVEALGH